MARSGGVRTDCPDRIDRVKARPVLTSLAHLQATSHARPSIVAIILTGMLLAACGQATPAPAPSATMARTSSPTPPATATSVPAPTPTALPITAIVLPPTATVAPPSQTAAPPATTVAVSASATITPAALYTADFATWFVGVESDPLPFRAGYDPASGEYRLALTDAARGYIYYRYTPEGKGFADFRLDIEARRVAGPTNGGSYGVVFRARPASSGDRAVAQYNFFVSADGTFALNLLPPTGPATSVVPRTASSAINAFEATNRLTVVCRGDRITLAINDQTVGTYEATLQGEGAIGLYIANPANPAGPVGMEVAFKNLRVSALPSGSNRTLPAEAVGRRR